MHVCLILFPGFPMLAYAFVRDILRQANAAAGQALFTCQIRTVTGGPVAAADGTPLDGDRRDWLGAQGFDLILLCAGNAPVHHLPLGLRAFLARADGTGATLGGVDGGALVLARLGLLDGHAAVLPASADVDLTCEFPEIALSTGAFAYDRHRVTMASGTATADAVLAWIARTHSSALAAQTAETLGHGRLRDTAACQRLARSVDSLLDQMQAIMAAHIAQPLSLARIAAELEVSPKHLRLRCRKGLGKTPAQIYLGLRLDRAAQLVQETKLSVGEVATASGFASPSAFTRSYHARFGAPPRVERSALRAAQVAPARIARLA